MNRAASEEGICPHTHLLPLSLSLYALNQFTHTHIHTDHPGGEICELWGSAEPLSRAVAIKQKHL